MRSQEWRNGMAVMTLPEIDSNPDIHTYAHKVEVTDRVLDVGYRVIRKQAHRRGKIASTAEIRIQSSSGTRRAYPSSTGRPRGRRHLGERASQSECHVGRDRMVWARRIHCSARHPGSVKLTHYPAGSVGVWRRQILHAAAPRLLGSSPTPR